MPLLPRIRVLLADDNAAIRDVLTALLRRYCEIEICAIARDGMEAVEMFRQHRPDIALMDIRMPRMDGIAATAAIRSEHPGACILVLTTFDLHGSCARARAAGAAGCLLKDTPHTELIATIRTLSRSHSSQ